MGRDLDPLAATSDHRQHRRPCRDDPHIVLQLRHIFFRRRFLRDDHGSMNLDSNTAPLPATRPWRVAAIHRKVGWRRHCWTFVMASPVLSCYQRRISFSVARPSWTMRDFRPVPRARLRRASPAPPQQGGLIFPMMNPGSRAAEEGATVLQVLSTFQCPFAFSRAKNDV